MTATGDDATEEPGSGAADPASAQEVDAAGDDLVVLRFDAEQPLVPIRRARRVTVIGAGAIPPWLRPARCAPLSELLRPGGIPALLHERPRRALVCTLRGVTVRGVLAARRHGVEWFHLMDSSSSQFVCNARGALVIAAKREAQRALGRAPLLARGLERCFGFRINPRFPSLAATAEVARAALELGRRQGPPPPHPPGPLRIVHCIGALGPGGAERQLTYLATAARAAGHDVSVLLTYSSEGDDGHYAPTLARAGVPVHTLEALARWRPTPALRDLAGRPLAPALLEPLEEHEAYSIVVPLIEALVRLRPHVVHCWLDEPNVLGGLAALLVGVPRIVVSTRNVNPTNFPRFHKIWYEGGYRALADCERVAFVANSAAGARDYARWLGLPVERFTVIHNGLPPVGPALDPAARARRRAAAGLGEGDLLVAAVFRLAREKRPEDLVRAVAAARATAPGIRVWHVGVGPGEASFRAAIRAAGLEHAFVLHGRCEDPWALVDLADVTVLCSAQEGCPNVSLESQARGIPVVLTDAGGSAETVVEGETGFVVPVGAPTALAACLVELARDPARARAMGEAGRRFVAERFSIEGMVAASLAAYSAGSARG